MGSSTALFSKNRVLEESLNPDETTCIHAQLYAINVITESNKWASEHKFEIFFCLQIFELF